MPNGPPAAPLVDVLIHRQTEHGKPDFLVERRGGDVLSVHLEHHGGYAYGPDWKKVKLRELLWGTGRRPSRAEMNARAEQLVKGLVALMESNPEERIGPHVASAFLAVGDHCVLLGDYHVYTRSGEGVLRPLLQPASRDPRLAMIPDKAPALRHILHHTHVTPKIGLASHEPSDCVHDLSGVDALIATTVPLHELPEWDEIVRAPLDSIESAGHVVRAIRRHGFDHGTDHVVIFRRSEAAATEEAARAKAAAAPKTPSQRARELVHATLEGAHADLVMTWGPHIGRPFPIHGDCLIGRCREADVYTDDDSASRRHARITEVGGKFFIRDLGSTYGTFVNDAPVMAERELNDLDRLRIGNLQFRFELDSGVLWEGHIIAMNEAPLVGALTEAENDFARGQADASLVLFEIDHLYLLRSTHGHARLDAVLAHVADLARELVSEHLRSLQPMRLRPEDAVVRLLGERFAVVLPRLGRDAAREMAERIRRAVEEHPADPDGAPLPVTISAGVASFSRHATRGWLLRRGAESRLSEAVALGGNQVR